MFPCVADYTKKIMGKYLLSHEQKNTKRYISSLGTEKTTI